MVSKRKGWWMRAEGSASSPHGALNGPSVLGAVMVASQDQSLEAESAGVGGFALLGLTTLEHPLSTRMLLLFLLICL